MAAAKPALEEDEIEMFIDNLLNKFEKEGKSYDVAFKAMENSINNARTPLTINEWVENSQFDHKKRRKYNADAFTDEAVKEVITKLMKHKKIVRIGQQTFCPASVVYLMSNVIEEMMARSCFTLTLEDIAANLLSPKGKQRKYPTQIDLTYKEIKNFIEEKIVRMALSEMETLHRVGDEYVHRNVILECADYAEEVAKGRTFDLEAWEFFDLVNRVDQDFIHKYSLKEVREALKDDIIRKLVLTELCTRGVVYSYDYVENVNFYNTSLGKVRSADKANQYRWLDE